MSRPRISIIIPTFNRGQFIAECLNSLLTQTLPASQIIVVNDGSTDNTGQALDPYRDKIEYFDTEGQLGKAVAINLGVEKVTGDYLWIFDDDDVALPQALERFVAPLEAHAHYGFSYSTFYYTATDPKSDRIGPVLYELEIPDVVERGFIVPLLEDNFLGGAALFARMSCYRELGPFDPALFRSQDYEMAIRIARRFSGVRVPGKPTFHYRQHEGDRGNSRDRFKIESRMKKWLDYDSLIFQKLYRELTLADYLAPGAPLAELGRQALLQRMTIMASKLLMPELLQDLHHLAKVSDTRPLSAQEKLIVRFLVRCWYHRLAFLHNHREFPEAVRKLSRSSKVISLLRGEILKAMLTQRGKYLGPRQMRETFARSLHLYWGNLSKIGQLTGVGRTALSGQDQ